MTGPTYSINQKDSITLERPVNAVVVNVGSVEIVGPDQPTEAKAGDRVETGDTAPLVIRANPGGAKVTITYFDEAA